MSMSIQEIVALHALENALAVFKNGTTYGKEAKFGPEPVQMQQALEVVGSALLALQSIQKTLWDLQDMQAAAKRAEWKKPTWPGETVSTEQVPHTENGF